MLSDGLTVHVRPIIPEDAERLVRFHGRQSPESIYFRYFSPRPTLSERDVKHFTNVDHDSRVAFVALDDDEIIAVARYERYQGTDVAEVAFFVDDNHHGRGLATLLLEYLVAAGLERGIGRFTATTLPNNSKMLAVFSGAGYDVTTGFDAGVIEVSFGIRPTDASIAAMARRERRAEAASVRYLLRPTSIAVVGAGRAAGGIGAEVYRNLLRSGFPGPIHPVNRSGQTIDGRPALRSTMDLPDGVDLAVIATPAPEVVSDVDRCGRKGVKALIIVSAGFGESGPEGVELERQVLDAARTHGMRVLGPNCMGVLNTDPAVVMDASITATMPTAGRVAVFSEAGTLSAAMVEHAARTDMGVSTFVAAGNRLDVSATDLLSYWIEDENTSAVLLSLTGQDLVPRFVRAARMTSKVKPVVALNATGNIHPHKKVSGSMERRARAMLRQTGVIGVNSLSQLFDVGRVLAEQPVPKGSRVAVIGNSDGATMLAANACRGAGLDLVDLSGLVGVDSSVAAGNPVDLTFRATASEFAAAMEAVASSGAVDAMVVVHAPATLRPDLEVNVEILAISARHPELTVVATIFGSEQSALLRSGDPLRPNVPVFAFPEDAAHALGRLSVYRSWLRAAETNQRAAIDQSVFDVVDSVIEELDTVAVESGSRVEGHRVELSSDQQQRLLGAVGVSIAERRVVYSVEEAISAAEELGWPVVVKAAVRDRTTRSAASGVTLDVIDAEHLHIVWQRMSDAIGERMIPAVVQEFIPDGVDVAVRVTRDPSGAGTISVGLGGPARIASESELGVIPLSLADASSLVASSPIAKVLTDPLDRVPVVGLVHSLAVLAEAMDVELEINADPIIAGTSKVHVADVDIRIGQPVDDFTVRRIEGR